jgi:hypothetical protein
MRAPALITAGHAKPNLMRHYRARCARNVAPYPSWTISTDALPALIRPLRSSPSLKSNAAVNVLVPTRGPETAEIHESGDEADQLQVGPVVTRTLISPPWYGTWVEDGMME